MGSRMLIVGVDCASDARKVGLALAQLVTDSSVVVQDCAFGLAYPALRAQLGTWLRGESPALLAIDAPLGWPDDLRSGLASHIAGERLPGHPDSLFLRRTDHAIWRRLGKRPLEVGADRIARTARTALALVADLREDLNAAMPLAWNPGKLSQTSAIEVYPAATLVVHGLGKPSYKLPEQAPARAAILKALESELRLERHEALAVKHADVLDAALCALAGADFLRGRAVGPSDVREVHGEGWIWA